MGNQNSTNNCASAAKVLILSHQHFRKRPCGHRPEERKGNEKDVERLKTVLEQRGIIPLIHKDCTKDQVLVTLQYFCETKVNESCMAVIVMTHGGEHGELEAKDEAYNTRDVYKALCKCENTKLKLIFFVACRGNGIEKILRVENDDVTLRQQEGMEPNEQQRMVQNDITTFTENQSFFGSLTLNEDGFVVVYCTEEDRKGYRDEEEGTWYIQSLCNVLDNMQEPEDLWSLLTKVNNEVSSILDKKDDAGREVAQTPCLEGSTMPRFIIGCPSGVHQPQVPQHTSASPVTYSSVDAHESFNADDEVIVHPEEVQCLMYNSSVYQKEAERVTESITKIGLKPQKFAEFSQLLSCIEQDNAPGNKKCLFVVTVAQLKKDELDDAYKVMVDNTGNSSVKVIWGPSRRNTRFIGKPKVFFFLDPFTDENLLPTAGMQSDRSLGVPEHRNILRLCGFGINFMEQLCLSLENWPHKPEQSYQSKRDITRVIRRAEYETKKPRKGCKFNIQSTFTIKLKLIDPQPSSIATIMEEIEGPTECHFIVGKERMKIECDAESHDECHMILNHISSKNGAKRTKIETELPHIEHRAFCIFQTYKRDNTLPETLTCEDACDMVAASQAYRNIPDVLVQHCRDFVVNNCNTVDLVCAGLNFAVTARDTQIMDLFLKKVRSETGGILTCENFVTISTETVIRILQQDRLNCKTEMQLFQACVRWCENRPNYNPENLRNFMQPFIAHIRFLTMDISELMSLQICNVLSNEEIGAITKKMFNPEYDGLPKTISVNNSPRMSNE